jgi:ABC-type amino acid transport substrate-binding protein
MSSFRFLCFCLFISIFSIASSAVAATPLSIKLYLPDNFDANGKQIPNTRQITELFNYFEREGGLTFSIITLPWKRAQLEVERGGGIIYGFSKSTERLEHYHFSLPVITLHMWAISYGDVNSRFSKVADLQGKKMTSGLGLSHGIEFENAKNTVFIVQEDFISDRYRLKRLVANRSDFLLKPFGQQYSRQQVSDFIHHTFIPGFNDSELNDKQFNVSINPLFYDTIHFASGKGHHDDVIDRIDKVIQKGLKNGSLPKLLQKYE